MLRRSRKIKGAPRSGRRALGDRFQERTATSNFCLIFVASFIARGAKRRRESIEAVYGKEERKKILCVKAQTRYPIKTN